MGNIDKKATVYLNIIEVEAAMRKKIGIEDVLQPVEVPSDGCTGHMNLGPWRTWAARCGEFLLILVDYGNGNYNVDIQ